MGSILRSLWTGVRVGMAAYEMTRKGLVGNEILTAEFIGGLTLVNKTGEIRLSATSAEHCSAIPVEKTDRDCDGVRWNAPPPIDTIIKSLADETAAELRAFGLGIPVEQVKAWEAEIDAKINAARIAMGESYKR